MHGNSGFFNFLDMANGQQWSTYVIHESLCLNKKVGTHYLPSLTLVLIKLTNFLIKNTRQILKDQKSRKEIVRFPSYKISMLIFFCTWRTIMSNQFWFIQFNTICHPFHLNYAASGQPANLHPGKIHVSVKTVTINRYA